MSVRCPSGFFTDRMYRCKCMHFILFHGLEISPHHVTGTSTTVMYSFWYFEFDSLKSVINFISTMSVPWLTFSMLSWTVLVIKWMGEWICPRSTPRVGSHDLHVHLLTSLVQYAPRVSTSANRWLIAGIYNYMYTSQEIISQWEKRSQFYWVDLSLMVTQKPIMRRNQCKWIICAAKILPFSPKNINKSINLIHV